MTKLSWLLWSTHWGPVTHICISNTNQHCFRCRLFGTKPLSEPMWPYFNYVHTIRNIFQWNFSWNSKDFIQENELKNFVCEMAAILSWPQCVNNVLTCSSQDNLRFFIHEILTNFMPISHTIFLVGGVGNCMTEFMCLCRYDRCTFHRKLNIVTLQFCIFIQPTIYLKINNVLILEAHFLVLCNSPKNTS